jgi:hypothetical protein
VGTFRTHGALVKVKRTNYNKRFASQDYEITIIRGKKKRKVTDWFHSMEEAESYARFCVTDVFDNNLRERKD